MRARMKNPALILPDAMKAIQGLNQAIQSGGVPASTIHLVHLRVSQINSCSPCVVGGTRHARKESVPDDQLFAVAAWREAPYFSEAERAALALAEAVTRLDDRSDPVPDDIWAAAAAHYDERALAALVLSISLTNLYNRINVSTRQIAGSWG